ncbi:MAG: T9SS type A sorting domain-containing protein, partial [Chitinophagales bacterium]|nr:T9SS type A sorting domain-containing protein [Chitinophagales bacterium]
NFIDQIGPQGCHLETHINTALTRGNNSPSFANPAIPYICLNTKFNYSAYCNEKDGDSLVYSLIAPYGDATGGQLLYNPPYSYQKPFDMVEANMNFDSKTGDFSFTPTKLQTSIMAFRVEEYRRLKGYDGRDSFVYAGMTMRDFQLSIVVACYPVQTRGISSKSIYGATFSDSTRIKICGDSLYFESNILLENLPKDAIPFIQLKSPNIYAPKANYNYIIKRDTLLKKDTLTVQYSILKKDMPKRDYILELHGGYCIQGFNIENIISLKIDNQPISIIQNYDTLAYCAGGLPAEVSLSPSFSYTWQPLDSVYYNPIKRVLIFNPTQNTTYTIFQKSTCPVLNIAKEITIKTSSIPTNSISPKIIENTYNKPLNIKLELDSQFAPFQYDWTPKKWLYDANNIERYDIQQPYTKAQDTTIYRVTITDKNGCRFQKEAQINVIKTKLRFHFFVDINKNNKQDSDEVNFNRGLLNIKSNQEEYKISPNQYGNIEFINALYGNIYLKFNSEIVGFKAGLPDSLIQFVNGKIYDYEIPLHAQDSFSNLSLSIISPSTTRQGVSIQYQIKCINLGNKTARDIDLTWLKKLSQQFKFSNWACDTSGKYYTWHIDSIRPYQVITIQLELVNGIPPLVNIFDRIQNIAEITYYDVDADMTDNKAIHIQNITGSYDPNLVSESHAERLSIEEGEQGTDLFYLVQFQNTGNDTAFNIHVQIVNEYTHDMNSFEMLYASHPYVLTIRNTNQLRWDFANILLPDSNHSEKNSHGYIYYKIKSIPKLNESNKIHNTAAIYFDYNDPVITNTNTISIIPEKVDTIGNNQPMSIHSTPTFNIYPNSIMRELNIQSNHLPIESIAIYNLQQVCVMNKKLKSAIWSDRVVIEINEIPKGLYYLHILTKDETIIKSFIKE